MPESPVISRKPPAVEALDFAELRRFGIAYLEQVVRRLWNEADLHDPVSGKLWRDFNVHDPGITLLELLSYGIVDVTYRTTFPDADLFASAAGNASQPSEPPFVSARQALTNGPVTVNDYRRLFLDRFPQLRNAWLDEVTETLYADTRKRELSRDPGPDRVPFEIRGLYRVRLLFREGTEADQKKTIREVAALYHEHRNLCEDLAEVKVAPLQDILVCAEVQLSPDADVEVTHAAILHALQCFLSPEIPRYSLAELVALGLSHDDIFQGPMMERGFILDSDLDAATTPQTVRASDLIAEILKVPGVRSVRRFQLNHPPGHEGSAGPFEWELPLRPDHHPRLTLENARFEFYKGPLPFRSDGARVEHELARLEAAAAAIVNTARTVDHLAPRGTWRDLGDFTSLQESLPLAYGVGRRGFDATASPVRVAKSKQLQAFLLIFDQLLANYLAQLTHLHELFSTDPALRQFYFTRAIEDVPNLRHLIASVAGNSSATADQVRSEYLALIESARQKHDSAWVERRSRMVDHLLARFGEAFTDHVLTHYSADGFDSPEDRLGSKLKFLRETARLSYERLRAHNFLAAKEVWDTANVSGFEKRLGHLLGFASSDRRNVTGVTYDLYEEKDTDAISEIRFRIVDTKTKKTVLSGTNRFPTRDTAAKRMREAIRFAMRPNHYRFATAKDGKFFFTVVDDAGKTVAMRKQYWATLAEAEHHRDLTVALIARQYSEEGFFLVENLLLRPRRQSPPAWPLLPAPCACGAGDEPATPSVCVAGDWDPYSFRVHLIFPGYTVRLQQPGFRRLVEEIVHRELPAHLAPRICFVGREQMADFEKKYRAWLETLASGSPKAEVLKQLIDTLHQLHTIHPAGTLHDCKEDGLEASAIVLNQSRLGSQSKP